MDRFPYHYELEACRDGMHRRCPGSERDRGGGPVSRCECACHDADGPEAAYDTLEAREEAER